MTLHKRLKAAVEARLAVAQAACREPIGAGTWTVHLAEDQQFALVDGMGWTNASGYMAPDVGPFIAANDPARVIRDCQRDLKVLERHEPVQLVGALGNLGRLQLTTLTPQCRHGRESGFLRDWEPWPCDEILDLAEAYEIGVDDAEATDAD